MIEAQNVTWRTDGRAIVRGINAVFAPGQLHLLIGPNGAGKSTLVKILARLVRPTEGLVLYNGKDAAGMRERTLARERAVLSQAVEIAFPLTVREVVMMGRYPHFSGRPAPTDDTVCDEVMRLFDIEALVDRSYPTLSGGERQRVNFARVLAQVWRPVAGACRTLFLDEPLTHLDIRHQLEFMTIVRTFAAAADVVVIGVVHDLALAARYADRLLLLYDGEVIADGSGSDVLTREHIQRAFHVEPVVFTSVERGESQLGFTC